jgi:hypothetical protein
MYFVKAFDANCPEIPKVLYLTKDLSTCTEGWSDERDTNAGA